MPSLRFSLYRMFVVVTIVAVIFAYMMVQRIPSAQYIGSITHPEGTLSNEQIQRLRRNLGDFLHDLNYQPTARPTTELDARDRRIGKPSGDWFIRRFGSKGDIYVCLQYKKGFRSSIFDVRMVGPFTIDRLGDERNAIEMKLKKWMDEWLDKNVEELHIGKNERGQDSLIENGWGKKTLSNLF